MGGEFVTLNMKCNNILFENNLVLKAISCVHFSVFCCELLIGC